jgi:hypothetical protein
MKKFFSENGGIVAVGVVFLTIVGGYIELRLPSDVEIAAKIDAAFVAAGQVAPHEIDAIEEDIDDLEVADTRMDSKIERIVDILLEE